MPKQTFNKSRWLSTHRKGIVKYCQGFPGSLCDRQRIIQDLGPQVSVEHKWKQSELGVESWRRLPHVLILRGYLSFRLPHRPPQSLPILAFSCFQLLPFLRVMLTPRGHASATPVAELCPISYIGFYQEVVPKDTYVPEGVGVGGGSGESVSPSGI